MADRPRSKRAGTSVVELARAKINLTLRVLGRRPDGYHDLESLVVFADVGDLVTLEVGSEPAVTMTGPFASKVAGENLAAKALDVLAAAEPDLRLGAVRIEKNLPVASGLGGGSADAAATLRAVRRANPAFAETIDWLGLAARLGADVPVCIAQAPALMWGVGEKLRLLHDLPQLPGVLVTADDPVPADKTREVFRRLDAPALETTGRAPEPPPAFGTPAEFITYLQAFSNDLTEPAQDLMPVCKKVEEALAAYPGCRLVRMSGAGPTVFGLFESVEAARSAADALAEGHRGWWVRSVMLG